MSELLSLRCNKEKVGRELVFKKWVADVKKLNELIEFERWEMCAMLEKDKQERRKLALAEPSCNGNTNSRAPFQGNKPAANAKPASRPQNQNIDTTRINMPGLLESKHVLSYYEYVS